MPIRWNKFLIILFFLVVNVSFPQEKNPTVYPYGGLLDSSRFEIFWMKRIPLNFTKAYFERAKFCNRADFGGAKFNSLAYFNNAEFDSLAEFDQAQFHNRVDFGRAQFDSLANFGQAKFHSWAYFGWAQFYNRAYFGGAKFHSRADFIRAQFDSMAVFELAQFKDKVNFKSSVFNYKIDFREAHIDSIVDFSLAEIKDTILIGIRNSSELQNYDFMRVKLLNAGIDTVKIYSEKARKSILYPFNQPDSVIKIFKNPGAKIVLYGPVNLKIQLEKFKFLSLYDKLDYYSKKDIICTVKQVSFKGNEYQKERFELDYIFDKSTMYQKQSPNYKVYSAFNPTCWGQFLYNITMGLGYRPFRLAWWVLGFIILFTFVYYFWMPGQINKYIAKGDTTSGSRRKRTRQTAHPHFTDTILNCFYFSSMMFFTFRLKRDILTFFSTKEKRVVVGEWLIGLIIYISFLTLSKSGSILHTLKSLFVG